MKKLTMLVVIGALAVLAQVIGLVRVYADEFLQSEHYSWTNTTAVCTWGYTNGSQRIGLSAVHISGASTTFLFKVVNYSGYTNVPFATLTNNATTGVWWRDGNYVLPLEVGGILTVTIAGLPGDTNKISLYPILKK